MRPDERPISPSDAKTLFTDLAALPTLVLAISGGPDSTALLVLAARWRAALKSGPKLIAVTVDHGLRPESAREAKDVARLARRLKISHRTLRWSGAKPTTGLQAAARAARYRLLAEAARDAGASHVLTAHTRDDQAETLLLRLVRGSGLAGLAAMARISPLPVKSGPVPLKGEGPGRGSAHDEILFLIRPLLDVPKSRLIATLKAARIAFADDPSNRNLGFTRVRIRELISAFAQEGLEPQRLAVLARRLARANTAIERSAEAAFADLRTVRAPGPLVFDAEAFFDAPEEIALRVLGRAIAERGDEGPVELAKLESLFSALQSHAVARSASGRFRRTLAGALVTLEGDSLTIDRAPPRRPVRSAPALLTKRKDGGRKVQLRRKPASKTR